MKATYAFFTLSVLFVLALALPLSGQEAAKKAPIPADAAQAEATKLIKEVYGDEWAKAKTATQKQALAKKLLGKANDSKDEPASRFVLLRLAKDIATQAADGQTAFQAIDAMAETFQIDATEMKVVVLTKFASLAKTTAQHKSVAEQALELVSQSISQDNFAVADQLGQLALGEARKAREKELIAQAQGRIAEIAELVKAYEDVKAAKVTLEKTPDDPEANLTVGKYLCFVKGDWDRGLPMLALGKDDALKALAQQELQGAVSSKEQAKLGDGWWSLAEEQEGTAKKQIRERAGYWYQKALPGLSGLMKDKVEKRIGMASQYSKDLGSSLPTRVSGFKKTPLVGGGGGGKFEDTQLTAKVIGFAVTTRGYAGHTVIGSIQVLYSTTHRQYASKVYGNPGSKPVIVRAKSGYAVGALAGKGGNRLDGFKVVFMRDRNGELDPKDSYESAWVGGKGGGAETVLGGDGKLVVGIYGGCGAEFDGLGLVQLE